MLSVKTADILIGMNGAEITGARNTIAEHFERIYPESLPAVPAVDNSSSIETELDSETNSGIVRLAHFLKKSMPRPRKKNQNRAVEAYESLIHFEDRMTAGRLLDKYV